MRCSNFQLATVALSFLSPFAVRAIQFTNTDFPLLHRGQTFELTWTGETGGTYLTLATGPSGNLTPYETITETPGGVLGESYNWTVPSDVKPGQYALIISNKGSADNYSKFFCIESCTSPSSSGTSSASASPTATGATATATSELLATVTSCSSSCSATASTTAVPYPAASGNGTAGYVAVATGSGSGSSGQILEFTGEAEKVGAFTVGGVAAAALGAVFMML